MKIIDQGGYYDENHGNNAVDYTVDMVFCIDATASMGDNYGGKERIIDKVKKNAKNFYDDVKTRMDGKGKSISQLRVRIILFRDFLADGRAALMTTGFYVLPDQNQEFVKLINSIEARGGGDYPEDGLEALACAMQSDWTKHGAKKRQVIVVWTDASTHPLGYGKASPHYPPNMPQNMMELTEMWDNMDGGKRLVLFAPKEHHWDLFDQHWEKVFHVASVAGEGMAEQTYSAVIDTVVNTITITNIV